MITKILDYAHERSAEVLFPVITVQAGTHELFSRRIPVCASKIGEATHGGLVQEPRDEAMKRG